MKKSVLKKAGALALGACMALGAAACGSGTETRIKFFTWGNETEIALTRELIREFNARNKGEIRVEMTPVPTKDYETKVSNALRGRSVPDVIVAGDGEIKNWIESGGIAELDEYAANSTEIDLDAMWQDGVNRYRYDVASRRGGTGKLYGIMRDYSPSVLFYNKTAMTQVGIELISMPEEAQTAQYRTADAYFEYEGKKYFNNQIPLDWEGLVNLAGMLTSDVRATVRNDASPTQYGLYDIFWFCHGWSVGGDCLEWVEDPSLATGGKYVFTLFDEGKNYIVNEGNTVTVNGNEYGAGKIVSYNDKGKLTAEQKTQCTELPSQMEAMQYFVDLTVKYGVAIKPDIADSNSEYGLFSSKQCAMIIDTRYAVGIFRKTIEDFDWDVAPLPKHKDGIAAGHSGSLAYSITQKSNKKDAAWKFIEFMAGSYGETKFAEAGFTIPNTVELSNSEAFLQTGQKPANSKIFVDAAAYQRTGDWAYLPSKSWIVEWSTDLNDDVLMGEMSLQTLNEKHGAATQSIVDMYYSRINGG